MMWGGRGGDDVGREVMMWGGGDDVGREGR